MRVPRTIEDRTGRTAMTFEGPCLDEPRAGGSSVPVWTTPAGNEHARGS